MSAVKTVVLASSLVSLSLISSEATSIEATGATFTYPGSIPAGAYVDGEGTFSFDWGRKEVRDDDGNLVSTDEDPLFVSNVTFLEDTPEEVTGLGTSLGTFFYRNGLSSAGTGVGVMDMNLDVDVDGTSYSVTFPLAVKNRYNALTDDTGQDTDIDAIENADLIRFIERSIALVDGLGATQGYLNLQLLADVDPDVPEEGFTDASVTGELSGNAFAVKETKGWTAKLIATVTDDPLAAVPDPDPVPDSGTTIALLGTAFFLLGYAGKQKVRYES